VAGVEEEDGEEEGVEEEAEEGVRVVAAVQ
jgi:hypothetical protein